MTRMRPRLKSMLTAGLLAAAVPLMVPQLAAAATAHDGTYHVSGGLFNASTVNTPMYGTARTARTCVRVQGSPGSYGWTISMIWYDGGRNKILWQLSGRSTGTVCSPQRLLRCRCGPRIYDAITAHNLASIHGWWREYTN